MAVPNFGGPGYTKETIRVEYEWEPPHCSTCLVFGHSVDDCSKAPKRVVNRVDIGNGGSYGADDDGFIEVKRKKSCGNNRGTKNYKLVSMKHKTIYHPKVNQSIAEVSPKTAPSAGIGTFSLSNLFGALNIDKTIIEEVGSGNKACTAGLQEEGNNFNPVVDKINMIEPQLME
ncbi:zinc knuckle CX2CX4HX4C containing protein [Tanacetum coccineum]